MMLIVVIICVTLIKADVNERLEIICPPFEEEIISKPLSSKMLPRMHDSNDEYCECRMTEHGTAKTAIVKCDFDFKKDIVLKETLFSFRKFNVTSAYVRMENAKSALITAEFLSSWMDAPSSALDIWHCGKVDIEPTPQPHPLQLFTELKTFVGVGIIDCSLDSLPSLFLRDRSRGALRLKGCVVGRINGGLFHNINEVRYMNFEDTVIEEVAGPLSSSGVLTLSKKEIHAWDGIEFMNSTFNHIAPFSFNVTHKDEMERFIVKQSKFGTLEKGAITATGDIDVSVTNCSFSELGSLAIQVRVSGQMSFSNNVIEDYAPDSLLGLKCKDDSRVNNNTFFVSTEQRKKKTSYFMDLCGTPKVSYVVMTKSKAGGSSAVTSVVAITIVLVLCLAIGMLIWAWKNRSLLRFYYQKSDTPLWREERAPDGEEDTSTQDNNAISVVHNPSFCDQKFNY